MKRTSRLLLALVATIGVLVASLGLSAPAWAAGNFALHFTGPSTPNQNYVSTNAASYWATGFMFSADVRWDGTAGYLVAVSRPTVDSAASSGTGIALGVNDGKPFFALATSVGNRLGGGTSNTTLTPNVWYTISGSYDGQNVKVFIDGTLDATQSYGSVGNLLTSAGAKLIIGREFVNSADVYLRQRGFHGDIDNVIYGTGTTPATLVPMMRYKFSEGAGTTTADLGPRGYAGTLSNTNPPTWVQGSDPMTVTYASTEPGATPLTQTLRPYSSFTVKDADTFTRVGYTQPSWNTGPGTANVSPGSSLTMPLSSVTYYTVWSASNQTVTYQAGLGSGSNVSQTTTTGSQLTLAQYSAIGFTRTGYHQSGWTLAGVTYSQGSSVTVPSSSMTFVADWLPDDQTVTYVLNGGTGTAPSQAPVGTGSTITVAGTSSFSRAGYRFTGWTDGGVINYQPDDAYTVSAQPIQFTAQWQSLPQTITYLSGAGAVGTPPSSATAPTDGTFTVAAPSGLTRTGYTFAGWRDQSGDVYAENAIYTVGASPVTLTATWSPVAHRVTYVNSSDSSGTPPTQSDVNTDATFTIASGTDLTLSGYTFSGWTDGRLDNLGNPLVVQPGETYRLGTNDVQLAALWTPNPHAVSYRFAGGETGTLPSSSTSVTDATYTVPGATAFSRAGYTFAGWRDATGLYTAGTLYTTGSDDVVLTAEWTPNPHAVTYGAGLGSGAVPTQADVVTDATFTVAGTASVERTGYTFAGWKDGTGSTYQPGETYRMGTSAVAFTAQWIANTYNVRYFLNHSATGTAPSATTATTSSSFLTAAFSGFSLPGYHLLGWYDGEFTTTAGDSYIQGAADTTFYTAWQAQSHQVTYLAGGASGSVPTHANVDTDSPFDLASASGLTRSGYAFAGWAADGTLYPESFSYTPGASDLTFTATWAPTAHHIVFLAGRGAQGVVPPARDVLTDASFVVTTPNLSLPGYDFDGWVDCTDSPPSTDVRHVGDTIGATGSSPDLVFYCAQWTAQDHSVAYDANGGDGSVPTHANVDTDATFTVASGALVTREGFSFGGWSDGTSTYQEDDDYLMGATNVTLTAVWNPIFVTVSYLVGGGAAGTPPTQDPLAYGSSLAVASADGLRLDGQYFWGWSDGTSVYQPGETVASVTSDLELAATWGDHPLVTLPNSGLNPQGTWMTLMIGSLLMGAGGLILVLRRRRSAEG